MASTKNNDFSSSIHTLGQSADDIRNAIVQHLHFSLGRYEGKVRNQDWLNALSLAVRDHTLSHFMQTQKRHSQEDARRVYYFSLEYLMGRMLRNNLINLELLEPAREALAELNIDIDDILDEEPDMALGNGGLGRLASCFLDSLATLDYPAIGYGIYYEFGLFKQDFIRGKQVESPDEWQQYHNPWPIARPEYAQDIPLYGHVETSFDSEGNPHAIWKDTKVIRGLPWDIAIVGYQGNTVNFLRLWESKASNEFDLSVFNQGGYTEAVREKALSETISKVLYPNDSTENGKELRLVQQYFFVACSLKDIIRRYRSKHSNWDQFADKVAIQLNDTHPAVSVPELMRILLDEEGFTWEKAWQLCQSVFSYTNHTLLPEALEKWSVALFQRVLPRHLQIIFEINQHFLLNEVEKEWPGDDQKKQELSIIEEGYPQMIRMAYLSVIASHKVNGVAALHTQLLKSHLFASFNQLYPQRIINKTNGITPRRWLKSCNPALSALIDQNIEKDWPRHLDKLQQLNALADDSSFQEQFMAIKRNNKAYLASIIQDLCGITVNPDALFDVQIKRLHEYKRQHLNLLHIMALYRRILQNPNYDMTPRVFIFGAKAAPGYELAKNIIHAINAVGHKINNDPRVKDRIKVVFLPNYRVSLAEKIIPATDLSEQISTAGKEASGTGNMKLALNGALTIGTLDGANIEIKEEVGDDNIFIFGLNVEEVHALQAKGYDPFTYYHENPELKTVIDWLHSDFLTPGQRDTFYPLHNSLLPGGDPYLVLADFQSYSDCQEKVDATYRQPSKWAKMAIHNTASVGKFSSDRTIHEYAKEIWNLPAIS